MKRIYYLFSTLFLILVLVVCSGGPIASTGEAFATRLAI